LKEGFVQVYTGNGKGKTTAAFGVALRMIGAGGKVFIGQFLKSGEYSEIKAFKKLSGNIEIVQFGTGKFVVDGPSEEDINRAREGFERCKSAVYSGLYDLVIIDEINIALFMGMIPVGDVLELIEQKPVSVELILTGRYAPKEIIEIADLVTEMVEVKHYYSRGISARRGIED